MRLLLEKLLNYWQLRFLAIAAGVALIAYAVVLPIHRNPKADSSIASVSASQVTPQVKLVPAATPAGSDKVPVVTKVGASGSGSPWLGENRDVEAELNQAVLLIADSPFPRDFSDVIQELRKAADRGDATAQFLLGHAYLQGLGVRKDIREAERWYNVASDETHAGPAPVPANFSEAFESYQKAAEQGNSMAELYLGLANDLGDNLRRNPAAAAGWYRKAAAQGSASAACDLGAMYMNGVGLQKNSAEAARWFERAASRGNASAESSLGRMYIQGDGVPPDNAKAAMWLQRAAKQGDVQAQVWLSSMYAAGKGVSGNTAMAYFWISVAAASDDLARVSRDKLDSVLTINELAEGRRLTRAWNAQASTSSPWISR